MARETPTLEPERVRAGDTWKWQRALDDFKASEGWALVYAFKHQTNDGFSVTGVASGDDFIMTVSALTSADIVAGTYAGIARAELAGEKYTVWTGDLVVDPDLEVSTDPLDARTPARVIWDQLMTAFSTFTQSNGQIKSYVIGDRSVTY